MIRRCWKRAQLVAHVCWMSSGVQQGCRQLPWIEPAGPWNGAQNNGLEAATNVIVLQHKVMAADKWRHNEPRDHITLGYDHRQWSEQCLWSVPSSIFPVWQIQTGLASLAYAYVFEISTQCTLVNPGVPRKGTCKLTQKKTQAFYHNPPAMRKHCWWLNLKVTKVMEMPHEVLTWDWVVAGSDWVVPETYKRTLCPLIV